MSCWFFHDWKDDIIEVGEMHRPDGSPAGSIVLGREKCKKCGDTRYFTQEIGWSRNYKQDAVAKFNLKKAGLIDTYE